MRLRDKRVLITHSTQYMGPAIEALFRDEGARVMCIEGMVPESEAFGAVAEQFGDIDVLVANLAHDPCNGPVAEIRDEDWQSLFATLVEPLMRLVRYYAPRMAEAGGGKIVAVTSAAPLKGIPGSTAYCAARGAQNAFIRATGLEFAPQNVQINAIAQNYVSNEAYYPEELVATERFQKHLQRNVPVRRVAEPRETAELALFLASDNSNFLVGQVVPFAGGWVTST